MDKITILQEIKTLIKEGQLTKQELLDIYSSAALTDKQESINKQSRISDILYFIGGAIVFLGICIFVGSNWNDLNDFTKILATLGSSVAMYFAGVLIGQYKNAEKVAEAFFFLAALVAPLGMFVTMDIAGIKVDGAGAHSFIAFTLFFVNMLFYYIDKRYTFLVFSIIHGTWLFFALTTFLVGGRPFTDGDFIKYRWLVAGISHAFLGYYYQSSSKERMSGALYGFGSIEFLTAAMCLGGYSPNQNIFWELIFPGLTFGIIFLSVYLKQKTFLVFGTLYLMFYILKITGEYFTSGFGWSLSLIIAGFSLIGLGYSAFYLNKKYIQG